MGRPEMVIEAPPPAWHGPIELDKKPTRLGGSEDRARSERGSSALPTRATSLGRADYPSSPLSQPLMAVSYAAVWENALAARRRRVPSLSSPFRSSSSRTGP